MHTGDMMSGGSGGERPNVEQRLGALEHRVADLSHDIRTSGEDVTGMRAELSEFRLEATRMLGGLESRLAELKGLLDSKAAQSEVSTMQGTIRSLPTVWQLITLVFGILAGVFAIVRFGLNHP